MNGVLMWWTWEEGTRTANLMTDGLQMKGSEGKRSGEKKKKLKKRGKGSRTFHPCMNHECMNRCTSGPELTLIRCCRSAPTHHYYCPFLWRPAAAAAKLSCSNCICMHACTLSDHPIATLPHVPAYILFRVYYYSTTLSN